MGSLQKVLEKYHMDKWFQRDNLIILILAGILLVVIALPTEEEDKKELSEPVGQQTTVQESAGQSENIPDEYESLYAYAASLEEKLENILADMSGVGKVKVMITLETSEERVVEKDEPIARNNTTENDSSGGTRSVYEVDSGQETVYESLEAGEIPYVSKIIMPRIAGVVIVAEGAGTGNITKNITEIVQALFDLEAHKVKVVSMGKK